MRNNSKCPICNSKKTRELYSSNIDILKLTFSYTRTPDNNKTFRVVKCCNCSHVFCSPIPKMFYKKYEKVTDKEYLKHELARKLTAREVLKLISKYYSCGRLLDVGCATGDFLLEAKKCGFSVEGLELSSWSSKIARSRGLKIHKKTLRALSEKNKNSYDFITMWGVIEHFENPTSEMKYINKLLKPNGILILWTGDINSLTSKIMGRRWWYWQGQHIQYFTKNSLNFLASLSGFENIKTQIYPFVANYELLNNSLSRYRLHTVIIKFLWPLFLVRKQIILRLPGEMLWFGKKISKK